MDQKITNQMQLTIAIESAIRALTKADLNRLLKYARWLIANSPKSRPDFQAPDELINEAILRTLKGKRSWATTTPFAKHVMGVMRSCVFHSAHSVRARAERFDMDAVVETGTPEYASDDPEEAILAAKRDAECAELLADLVEHFSSDTDATAVLEGWRSGFSGPDIMDLNNMTKNSFEAAAKRIRRYARSYKPNGS